MSLTVAVIANVAADLAMIAILAFVMSRPSKLTPHVATLPAADQPAREPTSSGVERQRATGAPQAPGRASAVSAQA